MQENAEDLIRINAVPGERKICLNYGAQTNSLHVYSDMDSYKIGAREALKELFGSCNRKGKKTFCSISSGGETQEFRGELKLTGRGWEIIGDGKFEHSGFDVFGALVSEETDNVYMEAY